MRSLVRALRGGGRTIVLSSHDMNEVDELCDRVGIISGGRLLAEGPPSELRGRALVAVRAKWAGEAARLAAVLAEVNEAELSGGAVLMTLQHDSAAAAASINRQFVAAGLEVSEIRAARRSLQEVFLDLTGGRTGGADSLRGPRHRPKRREQQRRRRS